MSLKKIVCLGDSLTEGYDIDLDNRWTNRLENKLNIPIINKGISGDLTSGMLARFQQDVVALEPTHLILMGGTNDINFDLQNNLIIGNIKTMIRQAKFYNISSIIGIPTPCFLSHTEGSGVFIGKSRFISRIDEYISKLTDFAITDEQLFIDFGNEMNQDMFLPDGVHPNDLAQEVLAKNAFTFLSKL